MFKIFQFFELFKLPKLHLLILIFSYAVNCQEKKSLDYQDYGKYNDVASIISAQNNINNQTIDQFRPSKWASLERMRRLKRLEDLKRYQEYKRRLKNSQVNQNDNQFKRRSDIDDEDYYTPSFYANNHYGIVYPPAIQPIISLPAPAVLATPAPTYYRKYRPSASRNYYHRIYPSSVLRRRLASAASAPSSNYESSLQYSNAYSPSAAHSSAYYYGTGLIPHPAPTYAHPTYTHTYAQHAGFPNTHGLAHSAAEHDVHERTEVHSLLPIITVIGIGAFLIPLFTTFFTAMISSGGSCCQRQTALKERTDDPLEFRSPSLYEKTKDVWKQVEKAINRTY